MLSKKELLLDKIVLIKDLNLILFKTFVGALKRSDHHYFYNPNKKDFLAKMNQIKSTYPEFKHLLEPIYWSETFSTWSENSNINWYLTRIEELANIDIRKIIEPRVSSYPSAKSLENPSLLNSAHAKSVTVAEALFEKVSASQSFSLPLFILMKISLYTDQHEYKNFYFLCKSLFLASHNLVPSETPGIIASLKSEFKQAIAQDDDQTLQILSQKFPKFFSEQPEAKIYLDLGSSYKGLKKIDNTALCRWALKSLLAYFTKNQNSMFTPTPTPTPTTRFMPVISAYTLSGMLALMYRYASPQQYDLIDLFLKDKTLNELRELISIAKKPDFRSFLLQRPAYQTMFDEPTRDELQTSFPHALIQAVQKSDTVKIQSILQENSPDLTGPINTAITVAVAYGQLSVVQILLEKKTLIENEKLLELAKTAIEMGNSEILKVLVEVDNKIMLTFFSHKMGCKGNLACYAASSGDVNVLNLLLEKSKIDINALAGMFYQFKYPLLFFAAVYGHNDAVCLLLRKGANPNLKNLRGQNPDLLSAIIRGNSEIKPMPVILSVLTTLIIQSGAGVNYKNNDGKTLLHKASRLSDNDGAIIAQLLIEKGADINCKDNDGDTALVHAIKNDCDKIAQLLIEKGADINCKDNYDHTALVHAIKNSRYNIAQLLIEKGADINYKDKDGWTLLHIASGLSHEGDPAINIVQLLINKRVGINCKDNFGRSPLHYAAQRSTFNFNIVQLLIDNGAEINCKDKDGHTVLYCPIKFNFYNSVQLLINNDADVNYKDNKGYTPLHWAAQLSPFSFNIVQILLDAGANVNQPAKNGKTPLQIAKEKGDTKVVEVLEKAAQAQVVFMRQIPSGLEPKVYEPHHEL